MNIDALRTPGITPLPIRIGQTDAMYLPLPDGPYLIVSAGVHSVTVTFGPTSFTPAEAPVRAAAVAGLVRATMRG